MMTKRNGAKRKAAQRAKVRAVAKHETGAAVSADASLEQTRVSKIEAALAVITRRAWLVVQTWANSEQMVQDGLNDLGIESYVPREVVRGNVRRRRELVEGVPRPVVVKVRRPLFYGYVFVCLGDGQTTEMVRGVLGFAGFLVRRPSLEPMVSRSGWVEELQVFEANGAFDRTGGEERTLKEGDWARLTGGKFTGHIVQVLRARPGDKRIAVMMTVFGRSAPLDNVKVDHVERLTEAELAQLAAA